MAMCSGIACAQEQHVSNFEACVGEAKEKSTMENYSSWKCEGATAQRLAARPDQCPGDVKPLLRNVERRTRQLDDGLYLRIIWRTNECAGQCETRIYNYARDTAYMCEVRRHAEGRIPRYDGPPLRPTYLRRYGDDRYGDEYRPAPARRWGYYGPATRSYEQPEPNFRRRLEPEREARVIERRYIMPGWRLEYQYPDDDRDDRRDYKRRDDFRDEERRDGYRREDYRPPRVEYYYPGSSRGGDDRRDDDQTR
jgi:hypothetical protein